MSTRCTPKPVNLFFSYSHEDEDLKDELLKHLSILKRQGVIKDWHDRKIEAGHEWKAAIDDNLRNADIILLLISADFLKSDYCYETEMTFALERQDAIVIPIILRAVDWRGAPFGKLQVLPKDARPVTSWGNSDEAFENVAEGIRQKVENLLPNPR